MYFTYLLGWSNHNKFYYGVRYKESATLSSVGTTYFSSSKYVHAFIADHGKPDIIQIRKVFTSKRAAKVWEERVLKRLQCAQTSLWLNMSNVNAFKDIVMTDDIKQAISNSKLGKRLGRVYTNGTTNIHVKIGDTIPEGYVLGRTQTEKQKAHVQWLNSREIPEVEKQRLAHIQSTKTKGKPKPEGFGKKISSAHKGKPKPYMQGDGNNAKRPDVREKISEKLKGRKHFTDGATLKFVRPEDAPVGWQQTSIYEFKKNAEQI